jgi:hypothetical protein
MKKYLLPFVGIALVAIAAFLAMSNHKRVNDSQTHGKARKVSEPVEWRYLATQYQYLGWAEIKVAELEADIEETREPGKIAVMVEKLRDAKSHVSKLQSELAPMEKQAISSDYKSALKFQEQMRGWRSQLFKSWYAYRFARMKPEADALHSVYLNVMKNCEYDMK